MIFPETLFSSYDAHYLNGLLSWVDSGKNQPMSCLPENNDVDKLQRVEPIMSTMCSEGQGANPESSWVLGLALPGTT